MMFPIRALHLSIWLFIGWLLLRVWEMNFEVSPLPAWTLPAFVYLVLCIWTALLAWRLQQKHPLDHRHGIWSVALLVGGALAGEIGLTIFLDGWSAWSAVFSAQLFIGILIQVVTIACVGLWLRRRAIRRVTPEGLAPVA